MSDSAAWQVRGSGWVFWSGNQFCWEGSTTYNFCCRERTNKLCWDALFTYEACCYTGFGSYLTIGTNFAKVFLSAAVPDRAADILGIERFRPHLNRRCKRQFDRWSGDVALHLRNHSAAGWRNYTGCVAAGGKPLHASVNLEYLFDLGNGVEQRSFLFCAPRGCDILDIASRLVPLRVVRSLNGQQVFWFAVNAVDVAPIIRKRRPAPWPETYSGMVKTGTLGSVPPANNKQELELLRFFLVCGVCPLRRFGAANDGGYLMCFPLGNIVGVYSYGIGGADDWGFGVSAATGAVVHQYDCENTNVPTCEEQPCTAVFHRECLGSESDPDERFRGSLSKHLVRNGHQHAPIGSLLLKIDIEGLEWLVFANAHDWVLAKYAQVLVEFHLVGVLQPAHDMQTRLAAIRKLLDTFVVVHVHRNNFAPESTNVEVTMVNKAFVQPGKCALPQRHALDAPVVPSNPDLDPADLFREVIGELLPH